MTSKPVVRWFQEITKDELAEAGGKGANLGEMTRHGIPVPPGFVVTASAYDDFLKQGGLQPVIEAALANLDTHDTAALDAASRRTKEAIQGAAMPSALAAKIKSAYRELGGGYVAVRSSATAEDLPDASFAGQQSTFLNIIGEDEVVAAVNACWASLFEARAIFYRAEHGFDHLAVGIAVPIQRMVDSDVSGVMFTTEPVTNDRSKVYIEAVYGLGEAIVSGQINPDTYLLDKASLRLERASVATQQWELRRDASISSEHGANRKVDISPARTTRQKLDEPTMRALAEIGKRLENHYNHPQDIEWAIEKGTIYILQTRAITTLGQQAGASQLGQVNAAVLLQGSPASPGVGSGAAVIVLDAKEINRVKKGDVLVADMTTPDFVPAMKRAAAIVTDKGGRTCHAAIVSRELGVPCIVGTEKATQVVKNGQAITVDASAGKVYEGIVAIKKAVVQTGKYRRTKTRVYVNLADPELAERIAAMNVDGVGLLRAEFVAAHIGEHPKYMLDRGKGKEYTEKLAKGIRQFAKTFHPRPVVYRTTDFKTNEYRNLTGGEEYEDLEENPMIGFRGGFRHLAEPEVFRLETSAIKKVHEEFDNLYVMIPFVRTPLELAQIKDLLREHGVSNGKLWIMVEVPSTVVLLDKFLDVGVDGVSIGSNDLTQLILGADRDNSRFAQMFDERNEAVLWCLEHVIKTCRRRNMTVSICGQAPSFYPDLTARLVEWGITSVSVSPDMIDRTRDIIGEIEERRGVLPPQD